MPIQAKVGWRAYVSPVTASYLLDSYSGAAAAYSLRKLRTTYSGPAIRVRRSSDNTEQNIGFDASGNLDTTALLSFVGAGNGFVTIWYDQSSTNNIRQTVAANQPRIVTSGNILLDNGKPTVKFGTANDSWPPNGTSTFLTFPALFLANTPTPVCMFNVWKITDWSNSNGGIFGSTNGFGKGLEIAQGSVIGRRSLLRINNSVKNDNTSETYQLWNNAQQSLTSINILPNSISAFKNGNGVLLNNNTGTQTIINNDDTYSIGLYAGTYPSYMNQQEMIFFFNVDQSSNRSGIESNINAHYSIYSNVSSLLTSLYAAYNADSAGSSSLKTSLFAAYNCESNANDSFGSNNGTAVGGLTYTTGKIGNAFQFNGTNSQIDFGNTAFNFGPDSLSISMWFYPNAGNVLQCLVNKGLLTATEKGFNVLIDNRYNSNQRGISFAIGGGSGNYQQFSTTNQYTIGAWNHIVCIWDSVAKTIKIYLNGVQATTTITQTGGTGLANITDISNTARTGQFGAYGVGLNRFNGRMDATTIWQKELTQSEITELYNSGNGAQYIGDNFYKPTVNDALNTYNGTAVGGLTYGLGKVGTAFQFNGTNAYVSLPNNSLNFTGDFSYSFWVKMSNVVGSSVDSFIENLSLGSTYANGYNFLRETSSWRFDIRSGGGLVIYRYTSGGFTNGQWYHVVLSRTNNNSPKLYINNTLAPWGSITPLGTVPTPVTTLNPVYQSNQSCSIGGAIIGFLNGSIDGLSMWNKELTATEVGELYNAGNGKQYPY